MLDTHHKQLCGEVKTAEDIFGPESSFFCKDIVVVETFVAQALTSHLE